jgi:hypothetical protein
MAIVLIVIPLILFSSVSCAKEIVNTPTIVNPSIETITIFNTIGMAQKDMDNLIMSFKASVSYLENKGWTAKYIQSENSFTISALKTFNQNEIFTVSDFVNNNTSMRDTHLRITDFLFFRDYSFESTKNPVILIDTTTKDLTNPAVKFVVTLPGKIIQTNADIVEESSATWNLQGYKFIKLTMTTREEFESKRVWLAIGLMIITILAIIFTLRYLKKKSWIR